MIESNDLEEKSMWLFTVYHFSELLKMFPKWPSNWIFNTQMILCKIKKFMQHKGNYC